MRHEQHPIALQYAPGTMPEEEFDALCEDIKVQGQLLPIIMYEDKILSGWHRYRACIRLGLTPKSEIYKGDNPQRLVIALELLRRRHGATQRALAAARLVLDLHQTQDQAAQQVGVSKVHVNLVVQALNSKNTRLLKLLEDPSLTRGKLHEEMVDCGIINASASHAPTVAASPALGGDALSHLARTVTGGAASEFDRPPEAPFTGDEEDDFLSPSEPNDESIDLEGLLGAPPSAEGKIIEFGKRNGTTGTTGTTGQTGTRPDRRPKETPASTLAERFRGLTEADQISFLQLIWPIGRKLLKPAGLSAEPLVTPAAPTKPKKATAKGSTPAEIANAAIDGAKAAAAA